MAYVVSIESWRPYRSSIDNFDDLSEAKAHARKNSQRSDVTWIALIQIDPEGLFLPLRLDWEAP